MVRSAFWLFFAFAAAVVLALLLRANHGNVSILWPPYRIDLSSNLALVLAVVGFFVLHVLLLVLSRVFGLPQRLRAYRERRQARRANRALQGAALAWFEGRFDRAERLAAAATAEPSTAGVAALIAARSAHRLAAPERRDSWLRQAEATGQSATLLAEAEFALDDRRPDRALLAVDRLRAGGAEPRLALETSLAAWRQFGRWEQVLETVRAQNRKSGKLSEAELDALRLEAYEGLLAPSAKEPTAILERWRGLRSDERKRRDLAVPTVLALMRAGENEEARKIALSVLEREYDDTLVECYGALTTIAARTRLEQLERWRNRYGDRPRLLEMLGRVCASERLWGKAETFLLQSLAASDSVSSRVALAQLYEAIDRRAEASRQFQFAARLALGERPAMALTLEPARARGPGALGAPAHPESRGALPTLAALPGAAAAAGGLQLDDDESLSPMARPAPIPSPHSAELPPVDGTVPVASAGDRAAAEPPGGDSSNADDVGRVTPDSDVAADAATGSTTESSDQAAGTQGEAPDSSTASASPSNPAREGRKGGAGEEPSLGKD
ncbi:MAG: heme biosynthesis HemY N-terminal domain-containing protein [Burkholderiaceae bacterium]